MTFVAATAEYLNEAGAFGIDLRVRRVVETGVIVVYSRPFIASRSLPQLSPAPNLHERLRETHDQVLLERRTTYAHTEERAYRMVLELEEPDWLERFIATGAEGMRETWKEPEPEAMDAIGILAEANRAWFMKRIERLRQHLRKQGEPSSEGEGAMGKARSLADRSSLAARNSVGARCEPKSSECRADRRS
jgi:hypothetical protein